MVALADTLAPVALGAAILLVFLAVSPHPMGRRLGPMFGDVTALEGLHVIGKCGTTHDAHMLQACGLRSHMQTLIIYNLGFSEFTTPNDLY